MQAGKSLTQLAEELTRQQASKKDFLADTSLLSMEAEEGRTPVMVGLNGSPKPLTEYAHGQVATTLDIPKKYYDKMRQEAPALLASNVNQWLHKEPKQRLVRTLDGSVRAFLSERYRPLDNFDLATAVLPVLQEKDTKVISSELTERRMYIKAILPSLSLTIQGSRMADTRGLSVGDMVQAGIVISNSEVGAGSIKVEPLIYRLSCLNGMIAADSALRKYHVGRGFEGGEAVAELFTDETRRQDDKAFWLKVIDVVRGAFNEVLFRAIVDKMSEAAGNRIQNDNIPAVIELTAKRYNLDEGVQGSILKHLIEGGDLSQWGLINAVTSTANGTEDYELATELERTGGKILELAPSEWASIAA